MPELLKRPAAQVAAVLAAVALVKVVLSLELELHQLEAYYWMYAQHPQLSYYDHPGLVGWMIWLSTAVFGHSTLGVRAIPIALSAGGTWLVFLAGRRLYDDKTGRMAALLTALVPLAFENSTEASPDVPLIFFWAATMWAMSHVLTGGSAAWWYAAGFFLGGGMLSKYFGIFIAVGVVAFVVLSPEHRHWLKRKEPYLACLIAFAVFSPTLIWNAQNGWESLRYQSQGRIEEGSGFKVKYVRDFVVRQFALLTPAVCLWTWGGGLRTLGRWKTAPAADRFAAMMCMPLLLFMFAMAFTRSVRPHWTAPAVAASLLLCAAFVERGGPAGRRLHWATAAVAGAVWVLAPIAIAFWPRAELTGWTQLADEVKKRSPGFVMSRDYHDAAQLGYMCRPVTSVDFTAVGHGSKSFPSWWVPANHAAQRAVVVYRFRDYPANLDAIKARFDRVSEPEPVEVGRFREKEKYLIVVAEGYKP